MWLLWRSCGFSTTESEDVVGVGRLLAVGDGGDTSSTVSVR